MLYTIVYSTYVGNGHYVQSYDMIETDDLEKYMERYDEVIVTFAGWPAVVNTNSNLNLDVMIPYEN